MRGLSVNERPFWYALYKGEERLSGGERKSLYTEPIEMQANISPAAGSAYVEQFGNSALFDRVIVTCETDCPIDENSVLWVDREPAADGSVKHDYVVKKVARSIHSVAIAISKVEIS